MSKQQILALTFALAALVPIACARQGAAPNLLPSTNSMTLTGNFDDLTVSAVLPPHTVGEELPSEGLGSVHSKRFAAEVGGFTQKKFSQTLGFPPGTTITIRNLSKTTPHTFNVIKVISKKDADFPKNPPLATSANDSGKLEAGYRSGILNPGKSVKVKLLKAGIYLIGCAFHYKSNHMRDVLWVAKDAKPGPQATPPKSDPPPTGQPSPTYKPTGYSSPGY